MNSPIKNIAAITDFSKDFTKFQVNNLALISSVADEIKPGLSSGLMDGYFMERVDELVEDLYIIASQDMTKERQLQIKASCINWVNQHLRTASNMTLVALTLWLDGAEDGRTSLLNAAGLTDADDVSH
jgi:hypothetical protein